MGFGCPLEPPRRCDSNEYPQSVFSGDNGKNNVYPCKSQLYYVKVRFVGGGGGRGVKFI